MNYKKKVEKALELLNATLFSCHDVYYKNRLKKIREVLEGEEEDDITLFDLVKTKYNNVVFITTKEKYTELVVYPFDDVVQVVLRRHISNIGDWFVVEFPHIKTLEQFEQLYLSLTGKELGGE